MQNSEILKKYKELINNKPARARDLAKTIGISEAQLINARVDGEKIVRLQPSFQEILKEIEAFGKVMALTRNEYAVHEKDGVYSNISFEQHDKMLIGLAVNPEIDLRMFLNNWRFAFSVIEVNNGFERHSLQFFDKSGSATHKIYLNLEHEHQKNVELFSTLIEKYRYTEDNDTLLLEEYRSRPVIEDSKADLQALRSGWENLQDTHDFHIMTAKLSLGREQAFRLIGEDFAYKVKLTAHRQLLEMARDLECPIMVFVGNKGCIQIHTGPVKNLKSLENWFNVLDDDFSLHIDERGIKSAWVVKKPTRDGTVTAVEMFDEHGEIIITFFGKRKPGIPELELWRDIVNKIEKLSY